MCNRLALALGILQDKPMPQPPSHPVLITDLPMLLPLQKQNIALNALSEASVRSETLPWGEPIPGSIPSEYRHPDVILAADCVYLESAFVPLLKTLKTLMGVGDTHHDQPNTTCYFCMKKRRRADMRFVKMLRKIFAVEEVDVLRENDEAGTFL